MKKTIQILLLVMATGWWWGLIAQTPENPEIARRIERGIILTIRNEFHQAEQVFRDLIADYPRRPAGYFYLGATYQALMLDRENYDSLQAFRKVMKTAIQRAKELLKQNKNDTWALFFEGSAYLYISFIDSKLGKIWGSYRNASRGVGRLKKILKYDSTFYDAYLGVGSFTYWKSSKMKSLKWLPFISDQRRKAIPMMELAISKGRFTRLVGRDQLAWVYLDDGKPEEALRLALENYRLYPESRFFQWTLVAAYYRSEKFEEAFRLYQQLLQEIRQLPENNHYNEIVCLLRMAEIEYRRAHYAGVEKLTSELLSLSLTEDVRKRSRKKRKQALELKQQSARELAKMNGAPGSGPKQPIPDASR